MKYEESYKSTMYGSPERTTAADGTVLYSVPLLKSRTVVTSKGDPFCFSVKERRLQPDAACNEVFRKLQDECLDALIQNRQMFKHPPSRASLEAITPNWGIVYKGAATIDWSPYMAMNLEGISEFASSATLELTALRISRSSIQPVFVAREIESAQIDIAWDAAAAVAIEADHDLEEVSDIPMPPIDGGDGSFRLRNLQKEKAEAKARVRAAYIAADAMADAFYASYDVSDGESTFSEWDGGDGTTSEEEDGGA